ncbi:fucose permease [Antricoccus suffuscus]|uniref:Fucose permease n=2 Tax=Antricoccus suffuscus TaxID=1629062 RepID=A0A2T1A0S5_9ACTN|nr:fucose permease [Antricoccus suffuscus]
MPRGIEAEHLHTSMTTGRLRSARIAVTATFGVHALLFASWTAHIPQLKGRLGLSDGTLGTALLGAPIGSILAILVTGWVLPKFGSRPVVLVSLIGYCLSGALIGTSGSMFALFGTLTLWGAFQGSLDVAMNTQGVTIEQSLKRPIMSGLHGAWSLGALLGAAVGAFCVSRGITLNAQLLVAGIVCAVVVGVLTVSMLPDGHQKLTHRPGRRHKLFPAPVLILGAVAAACMICEGAAADWSAVYLRDSLCTSATYAAYGFAAFSVGMVLIRLTGNWLLQRISPRALLPALGLVATAGLTTALLAGDPAISLGGFFLLGLGLASVVPTAFSAAGDLATQGGNAGTSIATVSALGWAGFVCGPPLIGHLANLTSLPHALLLIPILTLAMAAAIRFTGVFAIRPHANPDV